MYMTQLASGGKIGDAQFLIVADDSCFFVTVSIRKNIYEATCDTVGSAHNWVDSIITKIQEDDNEIRRYSRSRR